MKRLFLILLAGIMLFSAAAAETADTTETAEVELDLTELTGSLLIARLSEIKADPWPMEGRSLRVIGQYYEDETRRALIVHNCGLSACEEVGLTLIAPEDAEFEWPEVNSQVIVTATLEPFDTEWGTPSARLILLSLSPLIQATHGT